MTTFGGSTIPPIFVPGAPAPEGIFLRSVGAFVSSSTGEPVDTPVPDPAFLPADTLICKWFSTAGVPPTLQAANPGWQLAFSRPNRPYFVFFRLADGTADDTFITPAGPGFNYAANTSSIGNTFGFGQILFPVAGGPINDAVTQPWDVFASAGGGGIPQSVTLVYAFNNNGDNAPLSSGAVDDGPALSLGFESMGSFGDAGPVPGGFPLPFYGLFSTMYFRYDDPSFPLPAFNIPYTPLTPFNGATVTQQSRWVLL